MSKASSEIDAEIRQKSEHFLRVRSNAPVRTSVSTFIGGLTFTTFTLLMQDPGAALKHDTVLLILLEVVLGCATLFFLLTSVFNAVVQMCLASIRSELRAALEEQKPMLLQGLDQHTLEQSLGILDQSVRAYRRANWLLPWGFLLVLISMVLIGFRIHVAIGFSVTLAFIALAAYLAPAGGLVFDSLRAKIRP